MVGVLLIFIGYWAFRYPKSTFFFQKWQYKDAEPTEVALIVKRVLRVFSLIIGAVFILADFGLIF